MSESNLTGGELIPALTFESANTLFGAVLTVVVVALLFRSALRMLANRL